MPSKWRKASVASLYWMRYFTGSQWSSFKSGVTWSRFDFFQDEPRGVVLDLLYARDLFIGYTCKSSIAIVQSWHGHGRNKLFCGTVRQERTDRRDSPECKKRSAAEATDVLFHWQCLLKMHSKIQYSLTATVLRFPTRFRCRYLIEYLSVCAFECLPLVHSRTAPDSCLLLCSAIMVIAPLRV